MKNLFNLLILFLIANNLNASDVPSAEYRALCYGINDNIENQARSLRIVLEDTATNMGSMPCSTIGEQDLLNGVASTIKDMSKTFKGIEKQYAEYRRISEVLETHEELGIFTIQGDEKEKYKGNALNLLRTIQSSLVDFLEISNRISDFEENYTQCTPVEKIVVEMYREIFLYHAESIRSIHVLLGDEIDTLFDQFILSNLGSPNHQYAKLYFRILKGYTTRKTDCMPEFGLCALGGLDKNPFKEQCDALNLRMLTIPKDARERMKRINEEKMLQRLNLQAQDFEVQQRPILEKHYLQALEILEKMGKLSAEEKLILDSLKQKYPVKKASVKKKRIRKKKKTGTAAVSSPGKLVDQEDDGLVDEDDEIVAPQLKLEMYPEAAQAIEQQLHAEDNGPKALPIKIQIEESDDEGMVRMDSETRQEIAQQEAQYEKDRVKKASPAKKRHPVLMQLEDKGDDDEAEEPVIHAQNAKLIEAFWHAEIMPWADFKKFMTSKIMSGKMETFNGSHRKFHFIRTDGSKISFPTYDPHKFGNSNVESGQLKDAREFLRKQLKVAEPPK